MANTKPDVFLGSSPGNVPTSAALDFSGSAVNVTETSSPIATLGADAAFFLVNVTAIATSTITPNIQAFDEGSQTWVTLFSGTAIAATGTFIYAIDHHIATAAAPVTKAVAMPLPHKIRLQLVVSAGGSVTYTAAVTVA